MNDYESLGESCTSYATNQKKNLLHCLIQQSQQSETQRKWQVKSESAILYWSQWDDGFLKQCHTSFMVYIKTLLYLVLLSTLKRPLSSAHCWCFADLFVRPWSVLVKKAKAVHVNLDEFQGNLFHFRKDADTLHICHSYGCSIGHLCCSTIKRHIIRVDVYWCCKCVYIDLK